MTQPPRRLQLSILSGFFAILRFPPDASIPSWATRGGAFFSVTRTGDELSVIAAAQSLPADVLPQATWRALKVHGPFNLSEVGVLASLAAPLAASQISLFVISTFDTDYLLVSAPQLEAAIGVLERAGHKINRSDTPALRIEFPGE